MDTRKRQGSLLNYVQKKIALGNEVETAVVTVDLEGDKEVSSVIPQKEDPRISEDDVTSSDINISHSESQLAESECTSIESASPNITSDSSSSCTDICCISDTVPFQPSSSAILQGMCRNGCNFVPTWFKQYPWLTLCRTKRSAYCIYCRSASKHGLLGFSKNASTAFVEDGYTNWKKARQKFSSHESSLVHEEAKLKWSSLNQPSIIECLSSEMKLVQKSRREAFFLQISALKYILRQGLALRGHEEVEGNLNQLLIVWAKTSPVLSEWLQNKKYMSPQIINELISIIGQSLLRMILKNIQNSSPSWYSIIADEARDVANHEQLNLSVRWVDDNYNVSEDPLGLFCLPNTKADTITSVIKDLLIRCALPLSMCRGQAYDGAATMKGKRSGVATQIKKRILQLSLCTVLHTP